NLGEKRQTEICDKIEMMAEDDKNSNSEFMANRAEGIRLYEGLREPKSLPWPGCFSKDTDILTRRGWINITELTTEDCVYSMNPYNHEAYYMPVVRLVRTYYEQMIHFEGKSINLIVSSDHNMLIEGKKGRSHFEFAELTHLQKGNGKYIPLVSNFRHYKNIDEFYGFKATDWLTFLGWYISEGCTYKSGTLAICQSKTVNPKKCKEIEELLDRMEIRWSYSSNKQYLISAKGFPKEAREELKSIGNVYEKHIPKKYLNLSPTLLQFLFESMMKGDGCTREKGGNYPVRSYYTASKQLADDFQELLQKLGLRGRLSSREGRRHLFKNKIVKGQLGYIVSVNGKERVQVGKLKSKIIEYNDFAYCLETPFHTVYTRRNGIAVWSGNCSNVSTMVTTVACDLLQAKLFPMVWNPSTMNWEGREVHDEEVADNIKVVMGWVTGPSEMKLEPDIDDILHNLVVDGTVILKKRWITYWTYVTRMVPKISYRAIVDNKLEYEVKYDYIKREKCVLDLKSLERVHFPHEGGSDENDLPHIIDEVYYKMSDLRQMQAEGEIAESVDLESLKADMDNLEEFGGTQKAKMEAEGSIPINTQKENYKIKCYEAYIKEDVNNDKIQEDIIVLMAAKPKKWLSCKPLHAVSRIGKRPWIIRPFLRRPGRVYGKSIPELVMNLHKELDAIHNQRIDAGNMAIAPYFFFRANSGTQPSNITVGPATGVPLDDPQRDVQFPSFPTFGLQVSFQEERIVMELIERLTFLTPSMMGKELASRPTVRGTLAVMSQGEQKFGLLARRIQYIVCDILSSIRQSYEENMPPDLQSRILGKKGNPVFKQLSPETIAGNYDCKMTLDLTSGNIGMEREINAIIMQTMAFDPFVMQNPAYGWEIRKDYLISLNKRNVESIIGPKPPTEADEKDAEDIFYQIQQEKMPDVPTNMDIKILNRLMELKNSPIFDKLSSEAKVIFTRYIQMAKIAYAESMQERMVQYAQSGQGGASQSAGGAGGAAQAPSIGGTPGAGSPGSAQPNRGGGIQVHPPAPQGQPGQGA
ncbi:MAG: LAGLIDADG family homing endonuclease, partial [Thermodesulfobacteriota bacterium]|nr:LAGLIDADG family homing endonuclease [Thermodesulfobacteriota bacterium]